MDVTATLGYTFGCDFRSYMSLEWSYVGGLGYTGKYLTNNQPTSLSRSPAHIFPSSLPSLSRLVPRPIPSSFECVFSKILVYKQMKAFSSI